MRAKASAENMAMTASLRKEQMKNESLEQALQQKVNCIMDTKSALSPFLCVVVMDRLTEEDYYV